MSEKTALLSEDIEILVVIDNLDNGIVQFIQKINNLGYKTVMSCSGMKKDHLGVKKFVAKKCPFICISWPHLSGEEMLLFLRFIGDCLYNSNWNVQYFSYYVVGYLPWGLNDAIIKRRFQKFLFNLRIMDFFECQEKDLIWYYPMGSEEDKRQHDYINYYYLKQKEKFVKRFPEKVQSNSNK